MNIFLSIVLVTLLSFVSCRDFYVGMFKKNDLLVAQDMLYKERVPYRYMYAKYGRVFNCKITYFRVSDRLGYGPGPKVQIIRGGLNHKYLVLKLTSLYNRPISVNVYVGCANTFTTTKAPVSPAVNHVTMGATERDGDEIPPSAVTLITEEARNLNDTAVTTAGQADAAPTTVATTAAA